MAWLLRKKPDTPAAPVAKDVEPPRRDVLEFDPAHLMEDIQRCCSLQLPVVVICPDRGLVCQGRFCTCSENGLVFELTQQPIAEFLPLSVCCVTLYRGGRAFLFGSTVREYVPQGAGRLGRLTLRNPENVVGTDMRESFRVPVVASANLVCRLMAMDGAAYHPKVVDISLGGVLVKFPPHETPNLALGDKLAIELRLGGETALLRGEIRRAADHRYGLFFYEHYHYNEFRSPDAFRRIVVALERHWLKERCD